MRGQGTGPLGASSAASSTSLLSSPLPPALQGLPSTASGLALLAVQTSSSLLSPRRFRFRRLPPASNSSSAGRSSAGLVALPPPDLPRLLPLRRRPCHFPVSSEYECISL